MPKNTQTNYNRQLHTPHGLLDLSRPIVMGIINLTPDSFYSPSRAQDENIILELAAEMIEHGAEVLDLGAMSARPGSLPVDENTERNRLVFALKSIRYHFPHIIISVDTWREQIAEEAVAEGADMINDISAGKFDQGIIRVAAANQLPYILMHMQGEPQTMQDNPSYDNVVDCVADFFSFHIARLHDMGIKQIILDPGFGFGKTTNQNYQLLHALPSFISMFDLPLLVGVSRKGMVQEPSSCNADMALHTTSAAHSLAVLNGASILRVHDVQPAVDVINIVDYYKNVNDL